MIPAEAVEAAARAIRDDDWPEHEDQIHHPVKDYMSNARAAIEAASPSLLADALKDVADMIEPYSGIGLANGATRGEVAQWVRNKAEEIRSRK